MNELVMRVKVVSQIPHKVVVLQGIIECDRIKSRDNVIIEYEDQMIHSKIMCFETFNKMFDEAVKGQEVAMAFYPTKELRSIKKSYVEKDGKYVLEKSTAVVWR